MKAPLFVRVFAAFLLIAALITVSLDVAARRIWQRSLRAETTQSLEARAHLAAELAQALPDSELQEFARRQQSIANARVTIIGGDGVVIGDSEADPVRMENHGSRPEVRAAFRGRIGADERRSATLGIPFLYVAIPFRGGALRLAQPLSELESATAMAWKSVLAVSVIAFLLSALLAAWFTRHLQRRVAEVEQFASRLAGGDFSARMRPASRDELARIASSLNQTAEQLDRSFEELSSGRNRLETLLNGMHEAVVSADADGRAQWMNSRFQSLFPGFAVGQMLSSVLRDPDVVNTLHSALVSGTTAETRSTMLVPGRVFQIGAAPLRDHGVVVVMQETTRVEQAERTRRDFIANVSHELKTPLTSVRGYIETLLELASEPKQREFLTIVERNAQRMSRLIEDLLTLARVESGEDKLHREPIVADALLASCASSIEDILRVAGQPLQVRKKSTRTVEADSRKIEQVMVNLLKFRPDGGRESYARYGQEVAPHLQRVGGIVRYAGGAPTQIIGDDEKPWWDAILVVEYPSPSAFIDMVTNEDFLKSHEFRANALDRGDLIATSWTLAD